MTDRTYQQYEATTAETACYDLLTITNPGGYNRYAIHPNIITQSMVASDHTMRLMSATSTSIIQIVKLTHDNIKKIKLLGALDSLATATNDAFNYAGTASMTGVWVAATASKFQNFLDQTVKVEGSASMRMTTNNSNAVGSYIQKDFGASGTDVSAYGAMRLYFRKSTQNLTIAIRAVDTAGLSAYSLIGVSAVNTWTFRELLKANFIMDQADVIDWTKLRYLRFVVIANTAIKQSAWVDNMVFVNAATANNLSVSLYDCGTTAPTASSTITDWTLLTSDRGNTSFNYSLTLTKSTQGQRVMIEDSFGLADYAASPLTVGNYIAIVCNRNADELVMFGYSTSTQPYANGKLFYSANGGVTLTEQTNQSMLFKIYSAVDAKIKAVEFSFNSAPKSTVFSFNYNDGLEHKHSIITEAIYFDQLMHTELLTMDYSKDNELMYYIDHDPSSAMTYVVIEMEIVYNTSEIGD